MSKYESIATAWAEAYGITDYKIQGSNLIYYVNYKERPSVLGYKGDTYKAIVNLKTGTETRTHLKRYNKKGWLNR